MKRNQNTIGKEISLSGLGLHTGKEVTLRFKPAPPNSGIRFVRTDLDTPVEIPATVESLAVGKPAYRNTTLERDGAEIFTVEHVLAACRGLQIDNLVIEITGNEPPEPDDGNYGFFIDPLKVAGVVGQGEPCEVFEVDRPITYKNGDIEITAVPDDGFRVSFTIQYENPHIGTQYATFEITPEVFEKELTTARTFILEEDVEKLREMGLIKGGDLNKAIVFNDTGMLNEEPLRFDDECVRQKIYDLIGDLSLLGAPIKGHIHAVKSGHMFNVEFVKELWKFKEKKMSDRAAVKTGQFDINQIQEIIPHRYPFLLVDKILELEPKKRVVGIKNVTINEPFFEGHFPGHPIMPAVLIIEAMAQVGGFMVMTTVDNPDDYLVYFSRIDKARFRKPVLPGDQLRFEVKMLAFKMGVCKMQGYAYVDGVVVTEAELIASIVNR